ncbi:MAG: proton-conducting transporter membrane subunit [Ferruginibacter sp.]
MHIGVFLLLRTHPLWEDMQWAKIVIIIIGAVTAMVATLIARVQPTVKTQIAYSSAVQIGLMFYRSCHWMALAGIAAFCRQCFLENLPIAGISISA